MAEQTKPKADKPPKRVSFSALRKEREAQRVVKK